jgi:copper chaperone NosL
MKRVLFIALFLAFMPVLSNAAQFQAVKPNQAVLVQKGSIKKWCPNCGMSLVMFYKTSHYIVLSNGSKVQFCSMHCLADTYKNGKYNGKRVKAIYGVDAVSLKPYPVNRLTYVVGSKVKGTMTRRSKYAFKSKADAQKFKGKNGGTVVNFNKALALARKDLAADKKMISMKRSKMLYPMGKKILNKKCNKKAIERIHFHFVNDLKAQIMRKSLCGKMNPKELQAVALYVAYQKSGGGGTSTIYVPKNAKCPVCGMFVAKYPRWAGEIVGQDGKKYYFDGVKDLMKFVFYTKNYIKKSIKIKTIKVSDYYTGNGIHGKNAYYVIGSNVTGPMGNELIPFSTKAGAETFKKDHHGKIIVKYSQITKKMVKALDE